MILEVWTPPLWSRVHSLQANHAKLNEPHDHTQFGENINSSQNFLKLKSLVMKSL